MAQETTGEFPGISPHDEYDELLDEVIAADVAKQVAELEELRGTVWLTDHLKSPDCPVVCLSYPDGTYNQEVLDLFDNGRLYEASLETDSQLDEIPLDSNPEDIMTNEKWLYSAVFELLRISEDPNNPRNSNISEIKQKIIALWMEHRNLAFASKWVSLLNSILPGGEVSDVDIESASRLEQEILREFAEAVRKITNKLIPEYREGDALNGTPVCEIARFYVETTLVSICEPVIEGSMTKEEFVAQIAEIQASFALSDWTHWECLSICAAMSDCDLSGFVQK